MHGREGGEGGGDHETRGGGEEVREDTGGEGEGGGLWNAPLEMWGGEGLEIVRVARIVRVCCCV